MVSNQAQNVQARIGEAGATLLSWFRALDFQTDAFPDLAERCLTEFHLADALSIEVVLELATAPDSLPQQFSSSGNFGQPPVTLFWSPHFVIDAYFWHSSTTSVHEHGFSGAFAVGSGSSLHAQYSFLEDTRFGDRVWIGDLSQNVLEVLREGAIRKIHGGSQFIHSLFHLENPSLSICVRTGGGRNLIPVQRDFSPVGLARDPFCRSQRLELLPRVIGFGLEYREKEMVTHIENLIQTSDAFEVWKICDAAASYGGFDTTLLHRLIARIPDRLTLLRARLGRYYTHQRRQQQLTALRHTIDNAQLRLVLGLLLNAQSLSRLRDGIVQLFATSDDATGITHFVNLVNEMGFKDGSPNMEAVVAGFGLSADESDWLKTFLDGGPLTKSELEHFSENRAFEPFVKEILSHND